MSHGSLVTNILSAAFVHTFAGTPQSWWCVQTRTQMESVATFPVTHRRHRCTKLDSITSSAAKITAQQVTIFIFKATLHQEFMLAHFLRVASTNKTLTTSDVKLAEKEKVYPAIHTHDSCQSFGSSQQCPWDSDQLLRCIRLASIVISTTDRSTTRRKVACGHSSAMVNVTNQKHLGPFHLPPASN